MLAEKTPIEPDLVNTSEGSLAIIKLASKSVGSLPRVAIIGAGVCGLGVGWRLAAAGCEVIAFERGQAGRGASWAAAGMLAAGIEAEPGEEKLFVLNALSQKIWPAFARELEAASGIDVEYRDEGTLLVALTRDDVDQLRFAYEYQCGLGIDLRWLSGAEVRRREPHLRPGVGAAVYSPQDHQVNNRRLVTALGEAFKRAGGRLRERSEVQGIETNGGRASGIWCAGELIPADIVVLAAGAWSRALEGLPEDARPAVRPTKGQMLALRMPPGAPLVRHVLWAPKVYLVPRKDGRLVIGGTVEEKGFDHELTAGGVFALLDGAWRAVPAIEDLSIDEMWVGFRPTSRDDAPILGPTSVSGLVLATGHHRNGILLTPVTADAVSRYVLHGDLPEAAQPFTLARFNERTRHERLTPVVVGEN